MPDAPAPPPAEHDRRVDYIEFGTTDVAATRAFYEQAFGWRFTDYGPDYTSFEDGRITGGFARAERVQRGGVLIVLLAVDLDDAETRVRAAGGEIVTPAFEFPGGFRFHFTDPGGNELAVWSERAPKR